MAQRHTPVTHGRLQQDVLRRLRERIGREIDSGNIPSAQFAFGIDGELALEETLGDAPSGGRFNMWSSTKAVVAALMWQLLGEHLIELETPVVELWPSFGSNGKSSITIEHLLVHSAGIPNQGLETTALHSRADRVAAMEQWVLEWPPGSLYEYHGLSAYWVLGELVEILTGDPLTAALRARVLDPLGLDRLELGVPRARQGDIQPLVTAGEPASPEEVRELLGFELELPVEDSLLRELAGPAVQEVGVPGGGGVSDAGSVVRFYQALLHNPDGLWDTEILNDALTNPRNKLRSTLGVEAWRSIGLEFAGEGRGARFRIGNGELGSQVCGHGGACGQIAWVDPLTGVSFAFYTNGIDRNAAREWHRSRDLNALASRVFT